MKQPKPNGWDDWKKDIENKSPLFKSVYICSGLASGRIDVNEGAIEIGICMNEYAHLVKEEAILSAEERAREEEKKKRHNWVINKKSVSQYAYCEKCGYMMKYKDNDWDCPGMAKIALRESLSLPDQERLLNSKTE